MWEKQIKKNHHKGETHIPLQPRELKEAAKVQLKDQGPPPHPMQGGHIPMVGKTMGKAIIRCPPRENTGSLIRFLNFDLILLPSSRDPWFCCDFQQANPSSRAPILQCHNTSCRRAEEILGNIKFCWEQNKLMSKINCGTGKSFGKSIESFSWPVGAQSPWLSPSQGTGRAMPIPISQEPGRKPRRATPA